MSVVKIASDGLLMFYCPGCENHHGIWQNHNPNPLTRAVWTWNGDLDKPTISPSILVQADFDGDHPRKICHSFVKDGQIQFLGDCTHALAGKTVSLGDFDE